jgi:hypothetical protein
MFADHKNLNVSGCSIPEVKSLLERDIQWVVEWLCANKLILNVVKTEIMMVGSRQRLVTHTENFELTIDGIALQQVYEVTSLGLKIDENLTWIGHVQNIKNKIITNLRVNYKLTL